MTDEHLRAALQSLLTDWAEREGGLTARWALVVESRGARGSTTLLLDDGHSSPDEVSAMHALGALAG